MNRVRYTYRPLTSLYNTNEIIEHKQKKGMQLKILSY